MPTKYRLPKWLANKKAIVVPESKEGESFYDACTISANWDYFKEVSHPGRITKTVLDMRHEFDFSGGIDFELFEENNPQIPITVYVKKKTKNEVRRYYPTDKMAVRQIVLYRDRKKNYFSIVSRPGALEKAQVGGRHAPIHYCIRCGKRTRSDKARDNHLFVCEGGKIVEFLKRDKETIFFLNKRATFWKKLCIIILCF